MHANRDLCPAVCTSSIREYYRFWFGGRDATPRMDESADIVISPEQIKALFGQFANNLTHKKVYLLLQTRFSECQLIVNLSN